MVGFVNQTRINQAKALTNITSSSSDISTYSDSLGTVSLTNVNWRAVILNSPQTQNFYLKNNGNLAYMAVTPTLTNFVFKDKNGNVIPTDYSQYFNISLDQVRAIIAPQQILNTKLTLVIASGLNPEQASFSFNIVLNFNQLISPADLNADGHVDSNDLIYFVSNYVQFWSNNIYNPTCDLNHDGMINYNDLLSLIAYYIQANSV